MPSVASPRRRASDVLVTAVLVVVAVCFAVPLLWLLLAAVDPGATLQLRVPDEPGLDNFAAVLTPETTLRPLLNSLVLCLSAAAITVVVATLAAYPLSRYQLRYGRPFLYTVLFATGLPLTAVMVPVYSLFARLDLVDTRYGTVLFLAATSLPIAVWLLKSFMDGVPVELEEAAWTDGVRVSTPPEGRAGPVPRRARGVAGGERRRRRAAAAGGGRRGPAGRRRRRSGPPTLRPGRRCGRRRGRAR